MGAVVWNMEPGVWNLEPGTWNLDSGGVGVG